MNNYSKCPVCGYWAFNGYECFDCGFRPYGFWYYWGDAT